MTQPRLILPGRTYLVTRRCTQRQFLLRPDEETKQIVEYCLAVAAARYDVETLAWIAMSDHYHGVFRDKHGNLPDFLAHFHKLVAKVLNDRWERSENLWSDRPCSIVHLVDEQDVFDGVVYVLCNPRAQRIIDRIDDWPGASSWDVLGGGERVIPRPDRFFRKQGRTPAAATLRADVPPSWTGRERAWREQVRSGVQSRERALGGRRLPPAARATLRRRASSVSHLRHAASAERPRELSPVIACRNPLRRRWALQELRAFRQSYRACVVRFLRGERAVSFPLGTYKHRQFCGPPRPGASGVPTLKAS